MPNKDGYSLSEIMLKRTVLAEVVEEAPGISTFWFEGSIACEPGQFLMLWIPEVGAKPFSIFQARDNSFALTIASVGPFTRSLFDLAVGSSLGYFGPFGRPFSLRGSHPVLVAGGYGAAPLLFLAERSAESWLRTDFVVGARTADRLLYRNDSEVIPGMVRHDCTDDGSAGFHGSAAEMLRTLLERDSTIDMVYTVGPERMMASVQSACREFSVDYQISLERHMKCGYGLCGSCCVDPLGLRMCVEGPILDRDQAEAVTEFGVYHRDGTGTRIAYN
jgi:dihydroorotate dehydrogenase electron transfer subunit